MALTAIKLRPGVTTQPTPLLNEGGWSESGNIRWKDTLPEKYGGYVQFAQVPSDAGVPLALQAWTSLANLDFLGIACFHGLEVFLSEQVYDITPNTIFSLVPLSISTTTGSAVVVIADSVNTPIVGEWFQIHDPISVGGIILQGSYGVTAIGAGTYSIMSAVEATSSVVAGGQSRILTTVAGSKTVTVNLPNHGLFNGQIASFPDPTPIGGLTLQGNYLTAYINSSTYEVTAATAATSSVTEPEQQAAFGAGEAMQITFFNPATGGTQVDMHASQATMANWGEFLMWCPQFGPVFVWMPASGTSVPAEDITTAPQSNGTIFVATQEEQLFCLGSVNAATGLFDPMLINWSDVADYTDFIPTVTNQAGDFRLVTGSRIVGGLALAGGNIIWTDLCAYWAQYLGSPLVWGFQPIGLNFGLVGPHAFGTLGANVFWMTQRQFVFVSPGASPQVMACAVWDLVFENMDLANLSNVVCETNSFYNEVSWEVPQADGAVTRATIQIDTGLWSYTVLRNNSDDVPRRAWIDQSVFGAPLAADATGIIWQHETGKNAGTQPLAWYLKTGIIMVAEGDQITFFREVKPDFKFSENGPGPGVVQCKIYVYQDPQDPPTVKGPFYITDATRSIPGARGRGRGIQFEFSGNDMNSRIRGGLLRYRGSVDGRR